MLRRLACGLSILSSLASGPATAAGADKSFLSAAITKTEDVGRTNSSKSEDLVTILNLSVGFAVGSGVTLGLKYLDYSQDDKLLEDENLVISGYGPMVGYMHANGFYGQFSYLMSTAKTYRHNGDKTTYEGKSGYVLDVGKVWDVGSSFGIGVALAKTQATYDEASESGEATDLSGEWSDSSLYPYLSLFLFF